MVEQILLSYEVQLDYKKDGVYVIRNKNRKKLVVYPAMWAKMAEPDTIFVSDMYLKYAKPYALKIILGEL